MTGSSPVELGRWPSATTNVVGVMGDPVAHSLSPLLHNTAFRAMGLDWVSVAFRVEDGRAREALAGMRSLGMNGLSVTTPHKEVAAATVDELSDLASRLGAVNCVTLHEGHLLGDSTDGEGFIRSLRRGCGFDPAGARCCVIGAGGAARAIVLALAEAGAADLVVVNRSRERAERAAALAGRRGRVGGPSEVAEAELVVQATSVGLASRATDSTSGNAAPSSGNAVPEGAPATPGPMPIDPQFLHEEQLVAEIVYEPAVTPFLAAARARGARTHGGIGMLVHQAAIAIERWTGRSAPVEEMWQAAKSLNA
jgi:shikimate dehydrogenase